MSSEYRQKNLVLKYIKENGSITSQEAWKEFGITRLSSVIHTMRKSGINIITITEESLNRYGLPCRYARYIIREEN